MNTLALKKMAEFGLTIDQAIQVLEAISEPSRSSSAERQARYRQRQRSERGVTGDVTGDITKSATETSPLPDKERSPTPPKEINPSPAAPIGAAPRSRAALDEIEAKLFEAAGLSDFRAEKSPGLLSLAPILDLIDRKYDLDGDILPVIREKCRDGFKPKTWRYFPDLVVERVAKRMAIPLKPAPAAVDWGERLQAFLANGTWAPSWGPKPGERGCKAPPELQQRIAA